MVSRLWVSTSLIVTLGLFAPEPIGMDDAGAAITHCDGLAWSNGGRLDVANDDGSARVAIDRVPPGPGPTSNHAPTWSPDGSMIAWIGSNERTPQVWTARADGSGRRLMSVPFDGSTNNAGLRWSPDGARLAWEGSDGRSTQVWVANSDGSGRSVVSTAAPGEDPISAGQPDWSPDGTKLVWSGSDGFNTHIWVSESDGSNRRAITTIGPSQLIWNHDPVWSPDGRLIAWSGDDQIQVAKPDGTSRRAISTVSSGPDPLANVRPQWSPDGTHLMWEGRDDHETFTTQIWVAKADGRDRRPVSAVADSPDPDENMNPTWSPSGAEVAWEGRITESLVIQVWAAKPDGTDRRRVSGPPEVAALNPAWSPDGGRIAWYATDGWTHRLWVADDDGSDAHEVSNAGLSPGILVEPEWRPRAGSVTVRASFPQLRMGTPASITIEVSAACRHEEVALGPIGSGCLADATVETSNGSLVGGQWRIGALNGTATATITGQVVRESCGSILRVSSVPAASTTSVLVGNACPAGSHRFTDIPNNSFATNDIACIEALGITTGTSPTTYSPTNAVTREQMAAFLGRLIAAQLSPA